MELPKHYVMIHSKDGDDRVEITFPDAPHLRWVAEFRDGVLVGSDGDDQTPEGVSWRDLEARAFKALSDAEDDAERERDLRDAEEWD